MMGGRPLLIFLLMAGVLCAAGCPRKSNRARKPAVSAVKRPERGPHGAPAAFWADAYMLEVAVDRDARQATVYVLNEDGRETRPIEAPSITLQLMSHEPPLEVALKPAPQDGDPRGAASRFLAIDPAFGGKEAMYGTVAGKVGGKEHIGEFDERARSAAHVSKGKKK
jgi:hypothetical protein